MNMLGMVYLMEGNPEILKRINEEVLTVCNFKDWNPKHYLDVAEMSLAVSLAIDWTAGALPDSTVEIAKQALIEKGLKPSYDEKGISLFWIKGNNNWNQVCHGGMIAAALTTFEDAPELSAKTINRALKYIPNALASYAPDGVYPEGASYWTYGTSFTVMTIEMLRSAIGSDFGIPQSKGFMESATFKVMCDAPSGMYYNFSDCSDRRSRNGDVILAWFASETGNKEYFEKDRFLMPPAKMESLSRLGGAALVWISEFKEKKDTPVPTAWKGDGDNPVFFFRSERSDPHKFYLGAKGGSGRVNHSNLDAGSFVFELNGVRWSIDPGNQNYNALEQIGFNLWSHCQKCPRWTLLTKNNFSHSTLTVNDRLFNVGGKAEIPEFSAGEKPMAVIDMTPVYDTVLNKATRTFIKESPVSLIITDEFETNDNTKVLKWQFITKAEVIPVKGGAILKQDGKSLKIEFLSHPGYNVSVTSLYPAPMKIDRQIKDLKRIELIVPAWTLKNNKGEIKVRLTEM